MPLQGVAVKFKGLRNQAGIKKWQGISFSGKNGGGLLAGGAI
jgi:hypothetical protein